MNDQHLLPDKTFIRPRLFKWVMWADDVYMCVTFLVRMDELTGSSKYFDEAIRQVVNFNKYLYNLLQEHIIGVSNYQTSEGLWHRLLDKQDSYTESSCTAMFTYSSAKAPNEGWIPARYMDVAKKGWEGLATNKITRDGRVKDICVGTNVSDALNYYYKRPAKQTTFMG